MRRTLAATAVALASLAPIALAGPASAAVAATWSSAGALPSTPGGLDAVAYHAKSTGALTRLDLTPSAAGALSLADLGEITHNGVTADGPCARGLIQAQDQTGAGAGTVTAFCDRLRADGTGARFYLMYGWSGLTTPNCVTVTETLVEAPPGCLANVSAFSLPKTKKGATKVEASWSDRAAAFTATG